MLAEIAWRWSFVAAAWAMIAFTFAEYLRTLPVTNLDLILLRLGYPVLVSQALAHIFHGSAARLASAVVIIFIALALLWIVTASLGRAATLKVLLTATDPRWRLRPLLGLNFLRAGLFLAAVLATFSAMIVAGYAFPAEAAAPGVVMNIFLGVSFIVWITWVALNWLLSLSAVFIVRDGQDTFGSITAAIDFIRHNALGVLAVSATFGAIHVVAFVATSYFVLFTIAILAQLHSGYVLPVVMVITLLYLAFADILYTLRLGAYTAIADREPESSSAPAAHPGPPLPLPGVSSLSPQPG